MKTDMKFKVAAFLLVLCVVVVAEGQSALHDMVKTEQAFSIYFAVTPISE